MFSPPPAPINAEIFQQFQPISCQELHQIVMSLAPKSCELDVLPACLFRDCLDFVLDFITKLVNKSLRLGQFVEPWKHSIMRPLIKGNPTVVS